MHVDPNINNLKLVNTNFRYIGEHYNLTLHGNAAG